MTDKKKAQPRAEKKDFVAVRLGSIKVPRVVYEQLGMKREKDGGVAAHYRAKIEAELQAQASELAHKQKSERLAALEEERRRIEAEIATIGPTDDTAGK